MTGIRDLARECGVSVATVSRALNGQPQVSVDTRRQIQEAARRIGYRPSHSARALVRGRSDAVGLLWDSGYEATGRRHPFLMSVLVGVKRALGDLDRHLLLLNAADHKAEESAFLNAALEHQLDGVVLMGIDERRPAARALYDSGLPCVAFDLPITGRHTTYVTSDNAAGAVEAVHYLHRLGHRRVATITGPADSLPALQRLAGFQATVHALGMETRPEYVQTGDFFLGSGYAAGCRLAALADRPTAVFVAGDEMAIGVMHALADAGIDVPHDVSVIGFDDIEAASLVRPGLTTIAQDPLALGAAAVEALLALVDADSPAAPDELAVQDARLPRTVPIRLVERGSCAPPQVA
jgi:LacI family transcriptional regulator